MYKRQLVLRSSGRYAVTLFRVCVFSGKLKRFVLLSSVGVERADKFPFVILNAFGVLDAKAKGEEAVRR